MEQAERLQQYLPLLRTCAGWKAKDLAEKLDVSRQTISAWENYSEGQGKKGVKLIALHYYAIRKLLDDEIARDIPDDADRTDHILGILLEVLVDHPERYTKEDKEAVISEAELMAPSIVKYPDRRKTISKVWSSLFHGRAAVLSKAFAGLLGMDEETKVSEETEDTDMHGGIRQFVDLLNENETFRDKLKTMLEQYDGEQTEEAVFDNVLLPLGQEYGISATYEDFRAFLDEFNEREMSDVEIAQIAGGGAKGFGANLCVAFGIGGGATKIEGSTQGGGGFCIGVGLGSGFQSCVTKGIGFD